MTAGQVLYLIWLLGVPSVGFWGTVLLLDRYWPRRKR